jgi:dUTP pyrophosphatase
MLFVQKLHQESKLPTRGSSGAAGYDLYSSEDTMIYPHGQCMVATGISIKVPSGTYGRVAPRSGLAVKFGIDVLAGVIDEDYRGEVKVILINHGDASFPIARGDRIAQLVLEQIQTPDVQHVVSLDETERGEGGFGSTGV